MKAEAHPLVSSPEVLKRLKVGQSAYVKIPYPYVAPMFRVIQLAQKDGHYGEMARELLELVVALDDRDVRRMKDCADIIGDMAFNLR